MSSRITPCVQWNDWVVYASQYVMTIQQMHTICRLHNSHLKVCVCLLPSSIDLLFFVFVPCFPGLLFPIHKSMIPSANMHCELIYLDVAGFFHPSFCCHQQIWRRQDHVPHFLWCEFFSHIGSQWSSTILFSVSSASSRTRSKKNCNPKSTWHWLSNKPRH